MTRPDDEERTLAVGLNGSEIESHDRLDVVENPMVSYLITTTTHTLGLVCGVLVTSFI